MGKLKNIEFLRIFLIICIIFLHVFAASKGLGSILPDISLFKMFKDCFYYSNNSVEGFFIISGFFTILTFKQTTPFFDFVLKKYIRLSPVIIFSLLLCFIAGCFNIMNFEFFPSVLTALLINQFGICWVESANNILWYTSVLFTCLLIYFSLIKFVSVKYNKWVILILTILGYGTLEYLKHGSFGKPLINYYGILNVGFLRGLGGVGLGCLIGFFFKNFSEKMLNINLNVTQKILFTILETITLLFIVWWSVCPHRQINCIIYVLVFALLLILFVMKKGFLTQILDKDIWVNLGKYQYSLYVMHVVIFKILYNGYFINNKDFVYIHPVITSFIILISILIFGVFTYHFVEDPCAKYFKQKMNLAKTLVNTEISGGG